MSIGIVIAALFTGCSDDGGGDDGRPAVGSWTATWEERQRLIPSAEAILNGGPDLCGERLGTLRTELPDLRPAPTEALDSALEDWISLAETVMFECPTDPDELADQLDTLATLAAEVDAGAESASD